MSWTPVHIGGRVAAGSWKSRVFQVARIDGRLPTPGGVDRATTEMKLRFYHPVVKVLSAVLPLSLTTPTFPLSQ